MSVSVAFAGLQLNPPVYQDSSLTPNKGWCEDD